MRFLHKRASFPSNWNIQSLWNIHRKCIIISKHNSYDDVSRMIYEMASICYDLLLNIELITQNVIDNGMKNALKNM